MSRYLGYLLSAIAAFTLGTLLVAFQEVASRKVHLQEFSVHGWLNVPDLSEWSDVPDLTAWLDAPDLTFSDRAEYNLIASNEQVAPAIGAELLRVQSASLPLDTALPAQLADTSKIQEVQAALVPEILLQDLQTEQATGSRINEAFKEENPAVDGRIDILSGTIIRSIRDPRMAPLSQSKVRPGFLQAAAREDTQANTSTRIAKLPSSSSDVPRPIARDRGPAAELRNARNVSELPVRSKSTYMSLPAGVEIERNGPSRRNPTPLADRRYSSIELPQVLRPTRP